MPRPIEYTQYITLLFREGFSALTVKQHLQQYGRISPISTSAQRQIWRIEKSGLTVEDVDAIVEALPPEWSLTDAFASDREGEEI